MKVYTFKAVAHAMIAAGLLSAVPGCDDASSTEVGTEEQVDASMLGNPDARNGEVLACEGGMSRDGLLEVGTGDGLLTVSFNDLGPNCGPDDIEVCAGPITADDADETIGDVWAWIRIHDGDCARGQGDRVETFEFDLGPWLREGLEGGFDALEIEIDGAGEPPPPVSIP